jgi:hypothetical protein
MYEHFTQLTRCAADASRNAKTTRKPLMLLESIELSGLWLV